MLKMKVLLAVFVLGLYARSAESYFYAVGPNVIRFEHDETILVGLLDESNKDIEVWLEDQDGVPFSKKAVFCQNQDTPKTLTVRVTENDLFKIDERELKPKTVKLVAKRGNEKKTSEVFLSYNTGHLVVQTDKPVYTPRQTIKVRVLPMTEDFRPAGKDKYNVSVDIIGPSGLTYSRQHREINAAFYQGVFDLPPHPKIGIWTVRAFFRGQYETEGRALFAVEEYVLPTFGVTIKANKKYILPDDDDVLKINVMAKYVYKKPVQGKASVQLFLRSPENERKFIVEIDKDILSFDGDADFEIPIPTLCQYLDDCQDFPDGNTLVIEARVFEDATGNDEMAVFDSIVFSRRKYFISFERTRTTFRKGMTFYIKANVVYPNGEFVKDKTVTFTKRVGDDVESKDETTDDEGQVTAIFNTPNSESPMEFMVECDGEKSDLLMVSPFRGDNQIQVEYVIRGGEGYLDAYTNRVGAGFTGIMFLLVSRGQVVDSFFTEIKTVTKTKLTQEQRELITSPTVRLIAFFIDKNSNAVVADSTKFKLPVECRGNGLNLKPETTSVGPGAHAKLTIEGTPGMVVGLNVIDKALLLVKNSQEILGISKMYEVMDAHDIGCGDGSGDTSELVFKNTGLTLITNAGIESNIFLRDSESCSNNRRRKRDVDDCETTIECCLAGEDFAFNLNTTVQDFDMYTACVSLAVEISRNGSQPWSCIEAAFKSCLTVLDGYNDEDIDGRSFGNVNRYRSQLKKITDQGVNHYVRDDFDESWLFENIELNNEGEAKKQMVFPDSITEWMVQGIGITKDQGFCVASPVNISAFSDFFIQLDLPYQATRLENINIKATLFYYGQKNAKDVKASMYLDHNPDYCSNSQPNERQMVPVDLVPNSAHTVRFPIIPIKQGVFEVIVTAMVSETGSPKLDSIKKLLYVKNEGIEERETIHICLDPLKQREDCQNTVGRVLGNSYETTPTLERKQTIIVDLTLPGEAIPKTGSATGYFSSNVMDGVVSILLQGVDKLLRVPAGCGEQTIIRLAPTVYAMSYLKTTKQITPEIEKTGHKYIRDGVNRELTFRKNDGSYGAWLSRGSSTWLTAFVAKVFCQAETFDSEVQIEDHIGATLNWIIQKTKIDGSFYDPLPVIHREMIGQINERNPTLTPFVMIALSECKMRNEAVNASIIKATRYLEGLSQDTLLANPYLLAISTYALALANSGKKYEFKNHLMSIKQKEGQGIYWGNPGGFPARAEAIETTAYALLATLQFDDITTSSKIVRWLTSQRNAEGSFRTTQDTVIGLQALSAYDIKTYSRNVELSIELTGNNFNEQYKVTRENSQVLKIADKLPVESRNNRLIVSVQGTGTGRLDIDLRYNRHRKEDEKCQLVLSDVLTSPVKEGVDLVLAEQLGRKCDICGNCEFDDREVDLVALGMGEPDEVRANFGRKRRDADNPDNPEGPRKLCAKFNIKAAEDRQHGMSIVNFGLETGMDIEKNSLDKLKEDAVIDAYEMPENGKGYLILYLNEINAEPTEITLILKQSDDDDDIQNKQPASVEVIDYYNPEIKCTKFYSTSPKSSAELQKHCDKGRKCKCLQNICAKDITGKLKRMNIKKKPAYQLAKHTCTPGEADYAVLVTIDDIGFDGTMRTATATVLETFKNGSVGHEKGAEMEFRWMGTCQYPDFEMETEYFIIGLDGHKISGDNEKRERYLYELMNTAVVIKKPNFKQRRMGKMGKIMTNYKKMMRKGCLS